MAHLYTNYTLAKFETDSSTRFPCQPHNEGATCMDDIIFYQGPQYFTPFSSKAHSSNHQFCSIPSSLYTLLDVYFLSSKWIAKSLLTYTKNLLRKTTKPAWMNERTKEWINLFPIFWLYKNNNNNNNNNNTNYGNIITYFISRRYNNWHLDKWNFVSPTRCW